MGLYFFKGCFSFYFHFVLLYLIWFYFIFFLNAFIWTIFNLYKFRNFQKKNILLKFHPIINPIFFFLRAAKKCASILSPRKRKREIILFNLLQYWISQYPAFVVKRCFSEVRKQRSNKNFNSFKIFEENLKKKSFKKIKIFLPNRLHIIN